MRSIFQLSFNFLPFDEHVSDTFLLQRQIIGHLDLKSILELSSRRLTLNSFWLL